MYMYNVLRLKKNNLISQVKGYLEDGLDEALQGCDIVVIPAGVPRKPGISSYLVTMCII